MAAYSMALRSWPGVAKVLRVPRLLAHTISIPTPLQC